MRVSGNAAVASGGLETSIGQERPSKSRAAGSSKAKPLETSLGTAEAPVASPQEASVVEIHSQRGQLLAGDTQKCVPPPSAPRPPARGLKWPKGDSGETATPRPLLASRTQPQLWPLHLGFIPIFFCSSFSLFPEWRQAGRLDCPEALPTSCRRQELGKHTVSPLWERQA